MVSSLTRRERYWVRQLLAKTQGWKCASCGVTPNALDIDHIDGNPTNNSIDNLRLLCRSCNTSRGIRGAQGIGTSLEREGEIGRTEGLQSVDATSALKGRVNYSTGSPEMQVNDEAEGRFRRWAIALLLKYGEYPLRDLVSDGAEFSGVSPNAVRNYLCKMLSPLYGQLETFRFGGSGPTFARIKPRIKAAIYRDERTPSEIANGPSGGI